MEDWVSRVAELAAVRMPVMIYNNLSGLFDARLVLWRSRTGNSLPYK